MKEKHEEFFTAIGNNIRKIRIERGFSQQELANRCDVERGKISKIKNGREDFMVSTLLELAIALEVNIYQLVEAEGK